MKKHIFPLALAFMICLALMPNAYAAESWLWPVESCTTITSGRGYSSSHRGIDIPGAYGAAVCATKSGVVQTVYGGCTNHNARTTGISCTTNGCMPTKNGVSNSTANWTTTSSSGASLTVCNYGSGNGVIISHGDGTYSHYSHLSSTSVLAGQSVKQGDIIGYIGNSGNAAGAHLHFTLTKGSTLVENSFNNNPSAISYIYQSVSNPVTPSAPSVNVNGSNVTVSWSDVANETGYSVYLLQAPWGWADIKYSKEVSANTTSAVFTEVAPGDYCAFVISRPNADNIQSSWTSFTVQNIPNEVPAAPTIQLDSADFTCRGQYNAISWSAVPAADGYTYYLTEFPEGYAYTTNTRSGKTTGTALIFSDLDPGEYSIFIQAYNAAGTGAQSNWLSFTVGESDYLPARTSTYNGHIYAVYDYEMSWSFAKHLCEYMGGHLVTITSQAEQDFIAKLISSGSKDAYWIGASNFDPILDEGNDPYTWVTGEAFSFSAWASGEPSFSGEYGNKEHFAEIRKSYGSLWNDVNNINKYNKGFVIEIEPDSTAVTARAIYNGNEYLLVDKNTTWTEAKAYCEVLGGHLVTIGSSAEQDFVNSLIKQGGRAWYYLGAYKQNNNWKWLDGTPGNYITWNENEPYWNNDYLMIYKSLQNSVSFTNAYFPMRDIYCIGFICEIEDITPTIPEIHFPRQASYYQGQFTDVATKQWFTNNVADAYEFGLMKGDSSCTFSPYGDVTIAEAITMAARIHSIYTTGGEKFVQTENWYQVYLDYAYQNGIISYAYYKCDVLQKATRAQFAEIFANALPGEGLYAINNIADNSIPDVLSSATYAQYVYKLYRAGILAGGDARGTFSPDTFITRAEAAAVVSRMADSDNRIYFSLS